MNKRKICFVIHRYGLDVNGGAELHCRQLAEQLVNKYDVTVLTTKAIDYMTWGNYYASDDEIINSVKVKRFPVEKERNIDEFNKINLLFGEGKIKSEEKEQEWIEKQGPFCPKLVEYIKKNCDTYDVFIFFTYLYYNTVYGLPEVHDKSILIPTAHDEPYLNIQQFKKVFKLPKAIFYNTSEEKDLIESKFSNSEIKNDLGGVGVTVPEKIDAIRFKSKYHIDDEYMIYVGRIEAGKKCDELFRYFDLYKKRNDKNIKLVLMGKSSIDIPERDDVLNLGFVSDEDKFDGIAGSKFLILPSKYESLSMVVLEAFSLSIPVLVNGECEVLKGHCLKSNGGLFYKGYYEFEACVNYLLSHSKQCEIMGINGKKYVNNNYQWNIIIDKLAKLIDYVSEG